MDRLSCKINELTKERIVNDFVSFKEDINNEYVEFFAKSKEFNITIYLKKKEFYSLVVNASEKFLTSFIKKYEIDASIEKVEVKESKESKYWVDLNSQIGSDEVGTGDLFAPIVVVASYVKKEDINRLKELGVNDSKKLSDTEIRNIAKELLKFVDYSCMCLSNDKYNELTAKGLNMNSIKAKLHNQALKNVKSRHQEVEKIFIDEFVSESKYYSYLKDDEALDKIVFKTKGETYYPSVAVGSILARYDLLTKMDKLNKKYGVTFPLGAGNNVNTFAKELLDKIGIEEFKKLAKMNFTNIDKIMNVNLF